MKLDANLWKFFNTGPETLKTAIFSYNFEDKQLKEFISQYDLSDIDKFTTKFISISVEGDGIKFEKIIDSVMKKHFNLNSVHSGQAIVNGNTFTDLIVMSTGLGKCGIIDAKSTADYKFPKDDSAKMITYYSKSFQKMVDCEKLSFIGYICGNYAKGKSVSERLNEIEKSTKCPAFLINSIEFTDIIKRYDNSHENLFNYFEQGGILNSESYLQ